MSEQNEQQIAALLQERAGYERRELPDRVKAVNTELDKLGYEDPDKPKGRSSRAGQQSTADAPKKHTA